MSLIEVIKEMEQSILDNQETAQEEVTAHARDREDPVGADKGVP